MQCIVADKKHDSNGMTTHNPQMIFDPLGAITIPTRVQIQNRKGSMQWNSPGRTFLTRSFSWMLERI